MALVSVIIPTYNRLHFIGDAIDSVLAQTFKDYEILVVDDGSTVDVRTVLEPYSANIKYLYQENKGLASARNTGIMKSEGKYIAFLDDDDLFEPRKLEIQVPILENNYDLGFVYSDYYIFKDDDVKRTTLSLAPGRNNEKSEFCKTFFSDYNIAVPTVLVRRECFDNVGFFDESLRQHEDGDMFLRIALKWNVHFSGYPSAKVRYHAAKMSTNRVEIYKSVIQSWEKILDSNAEFKEVLGKSGEQKLNELKINLIESLIRAGKMTEAKSVALEVFEDLSPLAKLSLLLNSNIAFVIGRKIIDIYKNNVLELFKNR